MSKTENISWPGWETVKLIGRGSFGEVYLIQRKVFGDTETAALKMLSIPQNESDIEELYADGYDDESITSTFHSHLKSIVAEYSLMRKLNGCTNIVSCDDIRYVQHDDGFGWDIFIKMELLTPLLKAAPAEDLEEMVIKLGYDICNALVACKEYDIIHRDIKPQNIFVSKYGDYKLGDFGIAKTVERTMGGTKIGTYKYMAPEVFNNQPYSTAADICSLGLVMYWLLNEHRMPFLPLPPAKYDTDMEAAARARRFKGEQLPPPAHGSEELKAIVLKACAFDPKDRYATAAEMMAALKAIDKPAGHTVVAPGIIPATVVEQNVETPETAENVETPAVVAVDEVPEAAENVETPAVETVDEVPDTAEDGEVPGVITDEIIPETNTEAQKNDSTQKKKKKVILLAAGVLVVALIAFLLYRNSLYPKQDAWSAWTTILPEYAYNDNRYTIETRTVYSTRELETAESTETDVMAGWELVKQGVVDGFTKWSAWSMKPVEEEKGREIETGTRWRYRDMETTTSDKKNLEGWELVEEEKQWKDYGAWSEWDTEEVSESDSRQVETKEQYASRELSQNSEWGEWSDWSEKKVSTTDTREVKTRTLYRYRDREYTILYHYSKDKKTKTSEEKGLEGWKLDEKEKQWKDYGKWSDWEETKVSASDSCQVETKAQYRYRTKSTTTSSSETKSGWELYDSTYEWGNYGAWSDWSTEEVSSTASRDVETKTQYRYRDVTYVSEWSDWSDWSSWGEGNNIGNSDYTEVQSRTLYGYYYFQCPNCGAHMHGWGITCPTWAYGCGGATIQQGSWHQIWSTTSWDNAGLSDWFGTGKYYTYIDGMLVFQWTDGGTYTEYRYRTRELIDVPVYTDWSSWQNSYPDGPADREVKARTLYRSREREKIYTYYFLQWSDWSDWSEEKITATDTREVETKTLYRHRDRDYTMLYHYFRWGEWSKWSPKEVKETDTRKVQSRDFFRYRDPAKVTVYYFEKWGSWSEYTTEKATPNKTTQVQTKTEYRFRSK